jgi:signal transduction histidine kinase
MILGYMAFRGIRNDQALSEKESRKRLEMNSQIFFAAIDSSLAKFLNEQIAESRQLKSRKSDPSLLAFFVKDTTNSIKLATHQLLYLPPELLPIQPEEVSQPVNLKDGLRLEFIERRFSEALLFYQDKILKTSNPTGKTQSLVASARLYNKMNQPDRAKALYEKIRKDYPGSLLNRQIPLGLMAGLEILKINQLLGEKDEMRNNSRQCLELLLHPPCEYDENQFDLFYQSFKAIIPGKDLVIDSLFAELDTQKARTDYVIRTISGLEPLETNNNNRLKGTENRITCTPFNAPELDAIYLSRLEKGGSKTCKIIDYQLYMKSITLALIQKLDPNSSINVKIADNAGKYVFSRTTGEGPVYLSFPFPENLPKWKFLVSENKPGVLATLLKAGSGIYLLIFILIALLMVLGFVFTIYTLNEELRLNKMKSEFISNVSHELKSPLTSIRMMTEMLHHNRVQTEERKSVYYASMLEESEHLSHLIDNILDFSRMDDDRKKYNFIDLDMDDLLLKFIASTREKIPETAFDIRYSCADQIPVIQADKNAILQVLYNLVDNAIKFSGTSRQIDISLHAKEDELQLCVKDYGIGISGKDQEKVFDRFFRCDEPQRLGIKGSGIGLTIVKKIVEVHKGYLTLDSRPGEGSTFCVHLPLSKIFNNETDSSR